MFDIPVKQFVQYLGTYISKDPTLRQQSIFDEKDQINS